MPPKPDPLVPASLIDRLALATETAAEEARTRDEAMAVLLARIEPPLRAYAEHLEGLRKAAGEDVVNRNRTTSWFVRFVASGNGRLIIGIIVSAVLTWLAAHGVSVPSSVLGDPP